jgi:tetratricopeptide (TPR) repeat protein/phage shock protein PspC (stress-responsive transcriptional regulator)
MSKENAKPGREPGKTAAPTGWFGGLSRSPKTAVLAGVCAGLGERTQLPAWGWRLIFLAGLLLLGLGPLVYLALWIVLPWGSPPPPKVPPLFRRIDWWTFGVTTLVVFVGYYLTLAPDLTLEDSGELAVGSFYAGVPHPPGYPLWTVFTWLFTVLVPFSNIAWRVALASAVSGALSCGLIALIASRGSSMMLESIEELKNIDRRWESALCMASGYVAGMLIGFNGFMWSQSVIVEVYPFSLLSFMGVLCCLVRWIYAPEQRRYLYWAFVLFGVCFTNHQTLIVAAVGIEVAIAAAHPKLGRDFLLWNSICFLLGLVLKIPSPEQNRAVFVIFCVIGVASMVACGWMALQTQGLGSEFFPATLSGIFWVLGASLYFYMPIASSTNPPMNWGYPRTWEGFLHALTRGQYEKTNPTSDPWRFLDQMRMLLDGAVDEFSLVYLLIALIPFLFIWRLQKREKAWLLGLAALYVFLSVLLIILLNPSADRQSREMNRVFFTASHVMIALCVAYGLSIFGGLLQTQYARYRPFALYGTAVAAAIALYALTVVYHEDTAARGALFGLEASHDWLVRFTAGFSLVLAGAAVLVFVLARHQAPMLALTGLFVVMPVKSILSHWSDNEQRGHLFGYWFGHDMFTPPFNLYPPMARDAILFGGTDPGRFAPTYMIFCEGFIPARCKPKDPGFDRRDVYIITQNALADGTYLSYIRAHYFRSGQNDPPFFQEMLRTATDVDRHATNAVARMVAPLDRALRSFGAKVEARRRAEGVYPRQEIYTPSTDDHAQCMSEYFNDAQRRLQVGQLKPGEEVRMDPASGRLSVSGQVAVMAINALLTKVIFDHNPTNEFYVEESFPLDWMFPHLEPYGIIMRINRQPLAEMGDEKVKRDHEFWSLYSQRLIGNWITYDTPVKDVCEFALRVHKRRDYVGFTGDRRFIRDDQAQKSFSKLRSSIGGVYAYRVNAARTPDEQQRMLKEADFAFRQAFAFCPYSPEAVFRYSSLLASSGRIDDALLIADTCLRFDSDNVSIQGLARQLRGMKDNQAQISQIQQRVAQLEQEVRTNLGDAKQVFELASIYLQMQRTNSALELFDRLVTRTDADVNAVLSVANAFAQMRQGPRLETALRKLVTLTPGSPEAWYDLASTQAVLGRTNEALQNLAKAVELSATRLAGDPAQHDLRKSLATNASFDPLRGLPEFQKLAGPR